MPSPNSAAAIVPSAGSISSPCKVSFIVRPPTRGRSLWEGNMTRLLLNLAAVLVSCLAPYTPCWAQEAGNANLPLVWVLSTGGTIAGAGASSTNVADYKSGTILGEDLVKAVPEIRQFANVKVQQIINVRSPDVKLENLLT